jgi:hypothetical protein
VQAVASASAGTMSRARRDRRVIIERGPQRRGRGGLAEPNPLRARETREGYLVTSDTDPSATYGDRLAAQR